MDSHRFYSVNIRSNIVEMVKRAVSYKTIIPGINVLMLSIGNRYKFQIWM